MTKEDLEYFIQVLESRKDKICEKIDLKTATMKELGDQSGSDECDSIISNMQGKTNAEIVEVYKVELNDIEASLNKIKNNKYGICENCDEQISIERLKAKPHAKFCIECREIYEKQNRHKKDDN